MGEGYLGRNLAVAAGVLLLGACSGESAPQSDDTSRAASGEVLEGSISDEMLAIERLDSQPPVAAPLPGEAAPAGAAGAAAGAAAEEGSDGAGDADASGAAPASAPAADAAQPASAAPASDGQ